MSAIVIYHRADFDGIFCREIARKFLPDATLIGWDYGDPLPEVPLDAELFMLDISVDGLMEHPRLVWIDHHKSAMEKYPATVAGYRIDGVAACRLAWQWFARPPTAEGIADGLPSKDEYQQRLVSEPLSVRLAGEYDIWDKRDPNAELFQHGLRSRELTPDTWAHLLGDGADAQDDMLVLELLAAGEALQYAKTRENESIIKSSGFTISFEGLRFLACNAARYNSHLFTAGLTPEHDACFGFNYDGKQWRVSLYHVTGKEHHDLSLIAVKYGGGGHRGACGFRVPSLPFLAAPPTDSTATAA
jgi:Predicted phosphohydrolase (DHH superfamily)